MDGIIRDLYYVLAMFHGCSDPPDWTMVRLRLSGHHGQAGSQTTTSTNYCHMEEGKHNEHVKQPLTISP